MRRRCWRSTSSNWPGCCSSPAACKTRSRSCSSRPVLISATALPIRLTIALGVLAVACASALVFFHLPLPWDCDDPLVLPPIYLFGVWLSILLAIGVTSLYAFQVTEEARKLSDALAATELVLTREQHLTQLDGLAAAAAHELGTPLSTIFLIARELEKTVPDDEPARRRPQNPARAGAALPRHPGQDHPAVLHRRAVRPHEAVDPDRGSGGAAPRFRRRDQGAARCRSHARAGRLRAIRQSSTASATSWRTPSISPEQTVEVNAWWNAETIEIVISDDGPGIAPDMLKRIGEPYLSRRRSADDAQSERSGLGLGVFIARTLLERTGAKVSFTNRTFPDHGAVVQIVWPRSVLRGRRNRRRNN